jgi:hypothetical protein
MLNLEPIIARFVDDVLDAIRRASPEELREALDLDPPEPAMPARVAPRAAPRALQRRRASRERARAVVAAAVLPPPQARPERKSAQPEAPGVGEITDPGALLEAAVVADGAPATHERPLTVAEPEHTASAAAAADRPELALRAGESLARSSGNGVVIRRAKRG